MTIPSGGMSTPIDDELLSAYLDGQILPTERDAIEMASAADPVVRARIADLRATVALLHALPQPVPRRTFILTAEQAAAIRPARVPWITRLFPTVAAVSAVAAVLCLILVAGDLATGGFSARKQPATAARAAIESVPNATAPLVTSVAAAPTAAAISTGSINASGASNAAPAASPAPAAAAAALPPVTVAAGSAAVARSAGAPSVGAAAIAPTATVGSFAASTVAPSAPPTIVANLQPPPPAAAPTGGATVTKETHRVPVALVRAGEIGLALLALAGIALAVLGWRGKTRHR